MLKVKLSERSPVEIDPNDWVLQAEVGAAVMRAHGDVSWEISVRAHKDGRRLVYGTRNIKHPNGKHEEDAYAGYLITKTPDSGDLDAAVVRAIRRVAGVIENDSLAARAIGSLPAEKL